LRVAQTLLVGLAGGERAAQRCGEKNAANKSGIIRSHREVLRL
jgi:hypothetical protein